MDAPYYNGDVDGREFGPERDCCRECGADLVDDDHAVTCSYHADYFQPDEPEL